jgi:H+-transporting ATPase
MAIAYDNTEAAEKPIRWKMPRVLGVSSILGLFPWCDPSACC